MELMHCIYCSASTVRDLTDEALGELLVQCRDNNARLGVTGMLLYQNGSFFQILEGDRERVESLYEKIAGDKRHSGVRKLIVEPIEERAFGDWSMGYANVSLRDLARIPGLNDFFTRGSSYLELGEGRAKTLLAAFREGRWRATLT